MAVEKGFMPIFRVAKKFEGSACYSGGGVRWKPHRTGEVVHQCAHAGVKQLEKQVDIGRV